MRRATAQNFAEAVEQGARGARALRPTISTTDVFAPEASP